MRKEDLSNAELLLIEHFGVIDIYNRLDMPSIYRIMIEHSFMTNDRSSYSDALRAAWLHIQSGKYRRTLEFDNIILKQIRKGKLEKICSVKD